MRSDQTVWKQTNTPIAYILGGYLTSNLGAVRNLGRRGIPTVVLDANKNQISFLSRYTTGLVCPHPKYDEENYIHFLVEMGEHLPAKGVLIPTRDTEVLAILKHRETLERYYHFTQASFEIVNTLVNKLKFNEFLNKYGVLHPKTYVLSSDKALKRLCKEVRYPCIVKPVYTTYFRLDFHTKLFVARSSEELRALYKKAHDKKVEVILQEIIPGGVRDMFGYNAYYDRTGQPHGMFMYRRIHEWPPRFGNGCFIERVHEPTLERIMTPLMQKLRYYGIVDAEFMRDPRDGTFQFIEVNPRVWMQNSFPSRYGINFPYMAYMDAVGKPFEDTRSVQSDTSIRWVYSFDDIRSLYAGIKTRSVSVKEWLHLYQGKKEYTIYASDDPLPFFTLCTYSFFNLFPHLFRGKNL